MKANGDGRKCPQWCATDHQKPGYELHNCRSGEQAIQGRNAAESAWSFASWPPRLDKPYVAVAAGAGMVFAREPDEAAEYAKLVRGLADFTPAQIRRVAAQIDSASAAAFEPKPVQAEPEAGA